jgi:hypothetical protein
MTWLLLITSFILLLAGARRVGARLQSAGPWVDDSDTDDEQNYEPPAELIAEWQYEWLHARVVDQDSRPMNWLRASGQKCASREEVGAFRRSIRRQTSRQTRQVWLRGRQRQGWRRHGRAPRRAATRTRPTTSSGARSEPPGGDPQPPAHGGDGHRLGDVL